MGSEEFQGDKFEGENYKNNRRLGRDTPVTVDLLQRLDKTFFLRVNVRSVVTPRIISRYEIDIAKYSNNREVLKLAGVAAGTAAEHQCESCGDRHDPVECAKVAVEEASRLLKNV